MTRSSKIQYAPSLSVKENAARNGISVDSMRYYIKKHKIDRRYEAKANIIESMQSYLRQNPEANKHEAAVATGHGINTVRKYWDIAHGLDHIEQFRNGEKITKKGLREFHDFYATHPSCTRDILREEEFCHYILEPFCGVGCISEVLKDYNFEVESYDLIDRGYGKRGDFFSTPYEVDKYDIISNPPYNDKLIDVISRCISLCYHKVALIMPLRYLSGEGRYNGVYRNFPPVRVYVYQERINIAKNADFQTYNDAGANLEIYAWYVWEKGHKGKTELKWIKNIR